MSTVLEDYLLLKRRLVNVLDSSVGSLFVKAHFHDITKNVILSVTGKSGTIILLSQEDMRKVIELLEVICGGDL